MGEIARVDLPIGKAFLPLFDSDHRHYAYFGGRGSGKSFAISTALVFHASRRREIIVCARQYQSSLRESVHAMICQRIEMLKLSAEYHITNREIVNTNTRSRFIFIGLDRNPDSVRSLEGATMFWGEEAQNFSHKAIEAIIPTVRHPRARFIWSWNPVQPEDAVERLFRSGHPPEKSLVQKVSWRDNPTFLMSSLAEDYRRLARTNPARLAHIYEGEYDIPSEARVFPNVRIGTWSPVEGRTIWRIGLDFGFSNDATAAVLVAHAPDEGVVYLAKELYAHAMTPQDLAARLDQVFPQARSVQIIADPSRSDTIAFLRQQGYPVMGAMRSQGSVLSGINWLQGCDIVIDPDCRHAAREFLNYQWRCDELGRPTRALADRQDDHAIDAVRYACEVFARSSGRAILNPVVYI